jgi:hypothetical protein
VLKPILSAANELSKRVDEAQARAAGTLKDELVARFELLSKKMSDLAALNPSQAGGQEGAALFRNATPSPFAQRPIAPENPSVLAPMSPELRQRVAATAHSVGPGELPADLQAYIESEVIMPAFMHANDVWAVSNRNIAQKGADTLTEEIAKARTAAPAWATPDLDRLDCSVKTLRDEAQRLKFEPPPNPNWWRTVGGKGVTILAMTSDLSASVRNFNKIA